MKTLNIITTSLLLGTLTLGLSATIDEQITAIQNSTTQEERVELMNEFKTNISTLTQEERLEAITQLRTTMQNSGTESQLQTRERIRTRIQDGEQTGEMLREQKMNQNQAASKGMNQIRNSVDSIMGGVTSAGGQNGFMGKR
ncbi:hypothetical protein FJR48_10750 [Sulfurimonas lithotrophica]|uniref:Uncharacterized protein n=1 Tax=Sulfurimonas lithotrophica TaxID=2590022 RepID=A0A5P8P3J8_9BACT|nr:hypothetical protein [Sulfurimonas lithotrophica]QFR50181.1 hypothetical protein FJR48_10750 [Sulfurimonas lithotrophica]